MDRIKILVLFVLMLNSYCVFSQEDIGIFRYSPLDKSASLDKGWMVDLRFKESDKVETWSIRSWRAYFERIPPDTMFLERVLSTKNEKWKTDCKTEPEIEQIFSSGEVRYFLSKQLDKPECIPHSIFLSIKMSGSKTIAVTIQGVNGNVIAEGSGTPAVSQPDGNDYNLTELTHEEIRHNINLLDNRDELIGYWEGELDGEKIGFYNWYKSFTGFERIYGLSGGFLIGEADDCILEFPAPYYSSVPLKEHVHPYITAVGMKDKPYEYLNSLRYYANKKQKTKCSINSRLNAWKDKGGHLILTPTEDNGVSIKLYFITALTPDYTKGLPYITPLEAKFVAEGVVKRGVLPVRMKQLLVNQWPDLKDFLESSGAAMYFNPNKTFASVWKSELSNLLCNNNPFCYISGGEYIRAIYNSDFETIRELEKSAVLLPNERLIEDFVDDYIFHYKSYFSSCLEPDAMIRKFKKTVTQVNDFGTEVSNISFESVYKINPKFMSACNKVCGYRGFQDIFTGGSSLKQQTSRGVKELMGNFKCDDPAIKKLEINMMEALSK